MVGSAEDIQNAVQHLVDTKLERLREGMYADTRAFVNLEIGKMRETCNKRVTAVETELKNVVSRFAAQSARIDALTPASAPAVTITTPSMMLDCDIVNAETMIGNNNDFNFRNRAFADREERFYLRPVRNLRAKSANVTLPCDVSIDGVAGFLGCGAETISQVQLRPPNQLGKQRILVHFRSGEDAAAAQQNLRNSPNSTLAVLDHKRTALQNQLVNLAIQLQRAARDSANHTEASFHVQGDRM